VCPASFLSDLTALLFNAEPSRAEQCAACEGAARNALAALADETTQETVRPQPRCPTASFAPPSLVDAARRTLALKERS